MFAARRSQTRWHVIHACILHQVSNRELCILDARLQDFSPCRESRTGLGAKWIEVGGDQSAQLRKRGFDVRETTPRSVPRYEGVSKTIDHSSRTQRFVKLWCKKTVPRNFEDDMPCMNPRDLVDSSRSSAYKIVWQDKERLLQFFFEKLWVTCEAQWQVL